MVHAGQLFNNSAFTCWKDILFHSGVTIRGEGKGKKPQKCVQICQIHPNSVSCSDIRYKVQVSLFSDTLNQKNKETICGKEILSRPSCQYTENFQCMNSFMTPRYNKRKHMTSEQTSFQRCKKTCYQQNAQDP